MGVLIDSFGTSSFSLSFSDGTGLVHGYEDDMNNWIPITYETRIHQQSYHSDPEYGACLNMQEIRIMFAKFDRMIQQKQAANTFEKVNIAAFEFFYELEFEDLEEDEWLRFQICTNESARTNGEIQGVHMQLELYVTFAKFERFVRELKQELLPILHTYGLTLKPWDFQSKYEEFIQQRIACVRKLAKNGDSTENSLMLQELAETNHPRLRNEIALALSDLREEKAVDVLIDLVQQRKTLGNRGTLLYALEPLDYARYKPILIEQLIGGNYEVSAQCYALLENIKAEFSEDERTALRMKLDEKTELLRKSASLFD